MQISPTLKAILDHPGIVLHEPRLHLDTLKEQGLIEERNPNEFHPTDAGIKAAESAPSLAEKPAAEQPATPARGARHRQRQPYEQAILRLQEISQLLNSLPEGEERAPLEQEAAGLQKQLELAIDETSAQSLDRQVFIAAMRTMEADLAKLAVVVARTTDKKTQAQKTKEYAAAREVALQFMRQNRHLAGFGFGVGLKPQAP